MAEATAPVPVPLVEVGAFCSGATTALLHLAPAHGGAGPLRSLQARVDAALAPWGRAFGERSAPASWAPHVTLVRRVPRSRVEAGRGEAQRHLPLGATGRALVVVAVGASGDLADLPLAGAPQPP